MGRLENRVRKLEETVESGGFAVAVSRLDDEDAFLMEDKMLRVHDADRTGAVRPHPTPEVEAVWERLQELRADAIREGWGDGRYRIV